MRAPWRPCEPASSGSARWWPTSVSGYAEELTGYPSSDFIGNRVRSFASLVHPEDLPGISEQCIQAVAERRPYELEYRLLRADGSTRWVRDMGTPVFDAEGRAKWLDGTMVDITEEKLARGALRESEERYRMLVETMNEGLGQIDADGRIVFVNDRLCEMSDRARSEVIGKWAPDLGDEITREAFRREFAKRRQGGSDSYEVDLVGRDGTRRTALVSPRPLFDARGEFAGSLSVFTDITELKRTEQKLRASEERYRMLVETMTEGLGQQDAEGRLTYANDRLCEMFGRPREELIGRPALELIELSDREVLLGKLSRRPEGDRTPYEMTWTTGKGEKLVTRVSPRPVFDEQGKYAGSFAVLTDITERKRMEEQLRSSELLCRTTIDGLADALHVVDADLKVTLVNKAYQRWCEELGLSEDPLGRNLVESCPFLSDAEVAEYRRVFQDGSELRTEEVGEVGGRRTVVEVRKIPILENGNVARVITLVRDITERKHAEEALRLSEQRMRLILENSSDGISICEQDMEAGPRRLVMCNDRFVEMTGRSRKELMAAEDLNALAISHDTEEEARHNQARLKQGLPYGGLGGWRRPDGEDNYHDWTAAPIRFDGKTYLVGVDRDVTERRRAAEALRQSEERMRLILENSTDGINIAVLDLKTIKRRLVMCNDQYVKMTGRTREELMAADNLNELVVYHETPEELAANNRRLMKGLPYRGLASWIRPDGGENYLEWTAAPIRRGDEIYIIGIDRDVTERRRAEEELLIRDSAMRSSVSAVALFEMDGYLRYVNPAFVRLWGFESEEEIYSVVKQGPLWQKPRQALAVREAVIKAGRWAGEMVARRKDGTTFEVDAAVSVVSNDAGDSICLMGSFLDISARKRAEEAAQAAHRKLTAAREAERRRLAGDLHDSVGQGLVALHLGLQALAGHVRGDGQRLREMAGQCEGLIREIRAVCRGLYPPTLESLGLCAALQQLVEEFGSQARIGVSCALSDDAGRFAPDVEIALFRIAQEAVTNAVRHARAGRIGVDLSHHQGRAELVVSDDGPGFDPQLASATQGLGLNIMTERALAVGGDLKIDSRPGRTRIIARVPGEPRFRPDDGT
ncbi:MAG: sensor histidine kinase [Planctomycetota bacterium]